MQVDKRLQLENLKQNTFRRIWAYLRIFLHIQVYSHIQAYSGIIRLIRELFRYIQACLEPCVTLAYSKTWHIQNHMHIQNAGTFRPAIFGALSGIYFRVFLLKYLTTITFFTNYNFFGNISFSRSLFYKINTLSFFNIGLIFTPDVFILYRKVWGSKGPWNVKYQINKI